MKPFYKPILAIAFVLTVQVSIRAQGFVYKTGFVGFFDNREYFNAFVNDQTLFGSRISAELGYSFNENNTMMAGADYLYEFGSKGEWIAPDIIAYYHGRRNNAGLYIGAFPRMGIMNYPLALMTDTFQYYRPNLEGILLEYNTAGFSHNIWIDWTGRQSYEKRETFLLGFSGTMKKGLFTWQHHFVMTHLAHSMNRDIEEHIRDNAGFSVMPGIDLSGIAKLDSLTISAGILGSYDRIRNVYDFRFPLGFLGELNAAYRQFGLHGTLYAGESQVITPGDGFYKSTFYARADAYYRVANPNIDGKLQFSFHFLPGVVDLSMSLVIRAHLDGMFRHYQSN